ncbi:MAG: YebC/PmpR family DNA-binding transcriptional regulator, partial [Planctomycetes bacterium]|nr:YebC/PmpR family DNA-binding transcriptional regulator [Planctomycetota bacterium]
MAGHNKWSKVKHKKARVDKKRSKIWSSIARDIIVAARSGGGDPNANLKLSYAIAEAKRQNMPADTIDRAIKRGTGELEGADPEEVIYEGYGPGGAALMVMALTDNRARTAPVVRRLFDRNGGKQGEPGSVQYLFETKGRVEIHKHAATEEQLFELLLDYGVEDIDASGDESFDVLCQLGDLEPVKDALRGANIPFESAERAYIPTATPTL